MTTGDESNIDKGGPPLARRGVKWRDLPGTTLALTSLAILGAAAIVSTPMWVLYRRKRKRVDRMVNDPPAVPDATGAGTTPGAAEATGKEG
jgi:hypothetical protein